MQSCKNEWEIHYYTPGGNNYFIRFFDQAGNNVFINTRRVIIELLLVDQIKEKVIFSLRGIKLLFPA